jgi:hypothetical protein
MAIEKIKILGILPATAVPIQPIWLIFQCCLAGSFKTAPRILIFSIAMGSDYSFEVKNIDIRVPAFFKHNNSSVATVCQEPKY